MKKKKEPKQAKIEMMLPRRIKWFDDNGRFRRSVTIRPCRIGEFARLYEVSPPTVKKWLAPLADQLGPYINRSYSATQVEIIFRELGVPGWMEMRSSKLYALRDAKGRFADLQTYKRAHRKDLVKKRTRGDRSK